MILQYVNNINRSFKTLEVLRHVLHDIRKFHTPHRIGHDDQAAEQPDGTLFTDRNSGDRMRDRTCINGGFQRIIFLFRPVQEVEAGRFVVVNVYVKIGAFGDSPEGVRGNPARPEEGDVGRGVVAGGFLRCCCFGHNLVISQHHIHWKIIDREG